MCVMIEDTIEVLKTLSIFVASIRKYFQEKKFPEKFCSIAEDIVVRTQIATKAIDHLFDSLSKFHDLSSLNDFEKAASTFELIRLEDQIIVVLNELASIRIRLTVIADDFSKEPIEKVELIEKISVIEDILRYFAKEKLSEQIALQLKSSIENLLEDTTLEEADIMKVVQQSSKIKPDFSYRIRFVSEYPNLSRLISKYEKK